MENLATISNELIGLIRRMGYSEASRNPMTLRHFEAAKHLPAERQVVALRWACDIEATPAEMLAWDRAVNGEPLTQ